MDMDLGINSKSELYKRLVPALNCKVRELNRDNIYNIKTYDVWNYLFKTKWEKDKGLDLSQMVDDILNLRNEELIKYVNSKSYSTDIKNNEDNIEILQ